MGFSPDTPNNPKTLVSCIVTDELVGLDGMGSIPENTNLAKTGIEDQ